jgi:prepilin-type N-terminal cleavage/methylation domain-containing protein
MNMNKKTCVVPNANNARRFGVRGAFTLVELMTTLVIFALIATAATSMMASSANTQRYVNNNVTANSQVELAFRRIVENIRSSSQCACPNATEIDLVTQPDSSGTVYNISYTLVGTQLIESDDRYGTNVLCTNVSTFSPVHVVSTTNPALLSANPSIFQLTLEVSPPNTPPITRQATIVARNF